MEPDAIQVTLAATTTTPTQLVACQSAVNAVWMGVRAIRDTRVAMRWILRYRTAYRLEDNAAVMGPGVVRDISAVIIRIRTILIVLHCGRRVRLCPK